MNKKGFEMTFSAIIYAALALIILTVVILIFTGQMTKISGIFSQKTDELSDQSNRMTLISGDCSVDKNGECCLENDEREQFSTPINGWKDCNEQKPMCCQKS